MSHIAEDGPFFARAMAEASTRKKNAASKAKYICPDCALNACGKPGIHLVSGECAQCMEAEEPAG